MHDFLPCKPITLQTMVDWGLMCPHEALSFINIKPEETITWSENIDIIELDLRRFDSLEVRKTQKHDPLYSAEAVSLHKQLERSGAVLDELLEPLTSKTINQICNTPIQKNDMSYLSCMQRDIISVSSIISHWFSGYHVNDIAEALIIPYNESIKQPIKEPDQNFMTAFKRHYQLMGFQPWFPRIVPSGHKKNVLDDYYTGMGDIIRFQQNQDKEFENSVRDNLDKVAQYIEIYEESQKEYFWDRESFQKIAQCPKELIKVSSEIITAERQIRKFHGGVLNLLAGAYLKFASKSIKKKIFRNYADSITQFMLYKDKPTVT